ncbi:hypothetical protein GQ44DRAFT_724448 [Phaeosphaeriaceae sp. PMI808]|nr:hypothetical protein GQ44DRAFT_724448 [Phaeosphaeriaceae sp. PMI808]
MAVVQDMIVSMENVLDFSAQVLAVPAVIAQLGYVEEQTAFRLAVSDLTLIYQTYTTKFVVITSIFPESSSRTTSTSTISTCYTVTACTGSATTVLTTTQTATTVQQFCEPTSCGNACARAKKRGAPRNDARKLERPQPLQGYTNSSNLTPFQRGLPDPGTGDWDLWYQNVRDEKGAITINNDQGVIGSITAVTQVSWGNSEQTIIAEELYVCIALFCVSSVDVTDVLELYLRLSSNPFFLGPRPSCHIMAGTAGTIENNNAQDQETLTRSDPIGPRLTSQVDSTSNTIKKFLPSASVHVFAYTRQLKKSLRTRGYGKGAVLFDPGERNGQAGQGYATLAVYQQGFKAMQVERGRALEPCSGAVDPPNIDSSEGFLDDSQVTDVGPETFVGAGPPGQSFKLKDSAGTVIDEDCRFVGATYAPTADSGLGPIAGKMTCKDRSMQCTRPYNNRATTCGGNPVSECGTLGANCPRFYQLFAICRYNPKQESI